MGSSHSQQTYHGACSLKSAVRGCGRRLDQSEFRPMAEVSSPVLVNPANAKENRALLAGNEGSFCRCCFFKMTENDSASVEHVLGHEETEKSHD